MTYMLLDDAGNAINAYDDEAIAHAALRSIAAESPETEIVLIEYGASGLPVGPAIGAAELPDYTSTVDDGAKLSWLLAPAVTLGSANRNDQHRRVPGWAAPPRQQPVH